MQIKPAKKTNDADSDHGECDKRKADDRDRYTTKADGEVDLSFLAYAYSGRF